MKRILSFVHPHSILLLTAESVALCLHLMKNTPLVRACPLPPIMYITFPAHANSHLHYSIGREICWLRAFKVLRVQCPSLDHDCDLSSFLSVIPS